jgi:hypothetical protein
MTIDPKEDKVVKTVNYERDMSITTEDGTVIPIKGRVVETHYFSGRIDTKVEADRPLPMLGTNPPPQGTVK